MNVGTIAKVLFKFGHCVWIEGPKCCSNCHFTDACQTLDYVHTLTQL